MVKYQQDSTSIDQPFAALSDPTRRAILERLAQEDNLPVGELAEQFEMSWPAVSKHLRVLEKAGLLTQEKDGRIRRCHLKADPLQEAAVWINRYKQFWETQLDALADFLEQTSTDQEAKQEDKKQEIRSEK